MSRSGPGTNSYWVRVRNREQHEIEIHGGTKRGGGRRRITRWTKWVSHRAAITATMALRQLDAVKALNPLSDVQVFLAGKLVTVDQLHARSREDCGRAMYGDAWCASCDARERAGEGRCPTCAANGQPAPEMDGGA